MKYLLILVLLLGAGASFAKKQRRCKEKKPAIVVKLDK
jgi:hypothetical protein